MKVTNTNKAMMILILLVGYVGISYVYYRRFMNPLWIASIISLVIWMFGELINHRNIFVRISGMVFVISFLCLMILFIWRLLTEYSDSLTIFISLYLICLGLINDIRRIKK